jgi:hypothetical protein
VLQLKFTGLLYPLIGAGDSNAVPCSRPDLILAEINNEPRTHIGIGTVDGGTSHVRAGARAGDLRRAQGEELKLKG